jgi:hypothetical protein
MDPIDLDGEPLVAQTGRLVARLGPPRALVLPAADATRDLPGFVRAASAVRRWRGRLAIVQDDVAAIALVDERDGAIELVALPASPLGERSFDAARGNKARKLDLEASVVLPDGRLVVFGSGSTPARERIVVVDEALVVRVVDGAALYAGLRACVPFAGSELNVEGAAIVGDALWLFQRGNGAPRDGLDPVDAVGVMECAEFVDWIDARGLAPSLARVCRAELGTVRSVRLGFTDAAHLARGGVVVLAGAEASPNTFDDGECVGAAVGLLVGQSLSMTPILDERGEPTRLKLEGIEVVAEHADGSLDCVVVADCDDPAAPALLARLELRPRPA